MIFLSQFGKELYVDFNGDLYLIDNGRVKNREGIIKVDDMPYFRKSMIKLDLDKLLRFLENENLLN